MIYTIGNKELYEQYHKQYGSEFKKKGRSENYIGGTVFKTMLEAIIHKSEDYEVYGVLADWEKDTIPSKNGPWNDLLIDAPLVVL